MGLLTNVYDGCTSKFKLLNIIKHDYIFFKLLLTLAYSYKPLTIIKNINEANYIPIPNSPPGKLGN